MIELCDVSKLYKDEQGCYVQALDHVDLHVRKGEFVSIMGPSGSGKSSLMHVLGCLDTFDTGEYYLDGRRVCGLDSNNLASLRSRTIGFVFQSFFLLPQLSAQENIELPLLYCGVSAAKRKERSLAMLDRVGLSSRAQHRPAQLSGGQRQRVAIGRALINHPIVLLADEPTGNLDRRIGDEVLTLFHELHREGTTIVLITHDASVAEHAQRQLFLSDGRIESFGGTSR